MFLYKSKSFEKELDVWSDFSIEYLTNCYVFALNMPVNPYTKQYYKVGQVQPGNLGGKFKKDRHDKYGDLNANLILAGAKLDLADFKMEIIPSTYEEQCNKNSWKVALVMKNDLSDYHWYRQLDDGSWAHKMGNYPIDNKDNSRNIIENPQYCDRGEYIDFIGFFIIRYKSNKIINLLKQIGA